MEQKEYDNTRQPISVRRIALLQPGRKTVEAAGVTEMPVSPETPYMPPEQPAAAAPQHGHTLSVSWKFFLVLFLALAFNLTLMLLGGGTVMKDFYVRAKRGELLHSAELIYHSLAPAHSPGVKSESAGNGGGPRVSDVAAAGYSQTVSGNQDDPLVSAIYETEQSNIEVLIFSRTGEEGTYRCQYYTREQSGVTHQIYDFKQRIAHAVEHGYLAQCDELTTVLEVEENEADSDSGWIRLYRTLDGGDYLILSTPMLPIMSTSAYTVRFMSALSMVTLLVGSILAYLISQRITRPIRQIDEVARRLTVMDFSGRCNVSSRDEIGTLAESVNHMADQLRENIDLLQQRNMLLERDLHREEITNRQRRDFIASVSHDFKTPLSLITGYAETLEGDGLSEGQKEYCRIIAEQAGRVNGMVNHLLSLSRLESGMVTPKPTIFGLEDAFYEVLTACRLLLEKKSIQVLPLTSGEWFVNADYSLILQIITNLVENAAKYVDGHPLLRISFENVGDRVRAMVFNPCAPLPEETLLHLFEGFYRADTSRQLQTNSYGLGLAIVKAIVELHGCACGAANTTDPQYGTGVTFWFDLPCAEMPDEAAFEDSDCGPEEL